MDAMEMFDQNYQTIYRSGIIQDGVIMNMFRFSLRYFVSTELYKNRRLIKDICTLMPSEEGIALSKNSNFSKVISESLMDSIKTTITFENIFKAYLLKSGYCIHIISGGEDLKQLKQKQKVSPVKYLDLIAIRPLNDTGKLYFDGTKMTKTTAFAESTLQVSTLLKYIPEFDIGMDSNLISFIQSFVNDRNTLHYLHVQKFTISPTWYEKFEMLIDYLNDKIIPELNRLVNLFHHDRENVLCSAIPK